MRKALTVPFFTIVLRKGYGLGAMAMSAGGFHNSFFTASWPSGEFGAMGLILKAVYQLERSKDKWKGGERMNRREIAPFVIIASCALFIYLTKGMGVSIRGISLMAWLILALYFISPIVSLVFLYSDKSKSSDPVGRQTDSNVERRG